MKEHVKTLWEKEKMLVTSIFSFAHIVFCPFHNKSLFSSYVYFVLSLNAFNSDVSKIFLFGTGFRIVLNP